MKNTYFCQSKTWTMNKNYPIYKTTFIDDMRSLVEEAAQNYRLINLQIDFFTPLPLTSTMISPGYSVLCTRTVS